MAFVAGPRQVGKTTSCRQQGDVYLDWDNQDHREIILRGPAAVATYAGLDRARARPVVIVMDELHKYRRWKLFLKGFFDTYESRARIIVTGSSRLDVYRRGGDSLMGRYFLFRMHPLSVGELVRTDVPGTIVRKPLPLAQAQWKALWEHGGYPEPFLRRDTRFSRQWRDLRRAQILRDEVRDLTRIQELDQLEMLGRLLAERSGEQIVYSSLAKAIRVSENTVRQWISTLSSLYYGFLVRPWHRNVARALRKEPKWFLRDWSSIEDIGTRAETFLACHLLKAVEGWTDLGLGAFELRYVRDKQQREVDFLVVRD
ncbi:MAG: ATP-binding protein, partial [Phycisphaerae bacterium]|nr:ATP-binding protein [Phycisphaerae bacterium]